MKRRAGRRDEGATAVEMALILPVVLSVLFFAFYGALFFYYSAVADHVSRTVVRQISIPVGQTGSAYPDATANAASTDAANTGGSLIPNPTTVTTVSLPSGSTPKEGDLVTVTVTYKLPVLSQLGSVIPGFSSIDTLTRSATARRQ